VGFTYYERAREASPLFVVVWVHASGRFFGAVVLEECWPHRYPHRYPLRDGRGGAPLREHVV